MLLCATSFNVRKVLGCHGTMLATFQSAGNVTKRMAYTLSYNTITHCTGINSLLYVHVPFL